MVNINFTSRNFNLTDKIKSYIQEKINKHENSLQKATSVTTTITKRSTKNDQKKYKTEIAISMPHTYIKVEDKDNSIKASVDKLEVILKRRLTRYNEQLRRWNKDLPWKARIVEPQIDDQTEEFFNEDVKEHLPNVKIKKIEDNRPIHIAEAIEKMELLGYNCYLFKNIDSGKYSMVYKRHSDGYGLVEPKENN